MRIEALDPTTPLPVQFQQETGPVTIVNTFLVPPELAEVFLATWREDAAYMLARPGCVSTQLYRGTAGSRVMVNVAVWESTAALFDAFRQPEFQAAAAKYPDGIVARPHVLEKVAVPGICGA